MRDFITLLGGVAARYRILTDEGVLNVPMAVYVTVLAIVFGFAVPASGEDRPSDPFGNHTIELNKEAPLFSIWESLKDQALLDKARFHSCIEFSNASCPEVSALMKIVEEARQNQGKALLAHLNRSINLYDQAHPFLWLLGRSA